MADFNNILGQDAIINHLKNAIESKKVSHAYIIEGEMGSGKKMIAKALAKALQCKEHKPDSCGVCHDCKQVEHKNHPDVIWVTHEKTVISVNDIREQINGNIMIKPYSGEYKIYIIDEAERMNEAAQNALLKTIEEPPAYAIIILLANQIGSFLPTILSRCMILHVKPIEEEIIKKYLTEHLEISEEEASYCAGLSMGNIGKALRFAQSEQMKEMRKESLHLLRYMSEMDNYEVIYSIKEIAKYKEEIMQFLDMLMIWYHDILVLKTTGNADQIVYKEEYNNLSKQMIHMSYEEIETILRAFDKAKIRLKANVNFDVVMELLLLTIKENTTW